MLLLFHHHAWPHKTIISMDVMDALVCSLHVEPLKVQTLVCCKILAVVDIIKVCSLLMSWHKVTVKLILCENTSLVIVISCYCYYHFHLFLLCSFVLISPSCSFVSLLWNEALRLLLCWKKIYSLASPVSGTSIQLVLVVIIILSRIIMRCKLP